MTGVGVYVSSVEAGCACHLLRYRNCAASTRCKIPRCGLQYEGFDRVNVVVPRSLVGWGKVADVLTVDWQTANVVTINVVTINVE